MPGGVVGLCLALLRSTSMLPIVEAERLLPRRGLCVSKGVEEEKVKEDQTHGPWSKKEDRKLIQLVKVHGTTLWARIARNIQGRSGKQCRERWLNHLVQLFVVPACVLREQLGRARLVHARLDHDLLLRQPGLLGAVRLGNN